jgi:hypothetical protein
MKKKAPLSIALTLIALGSASASASQNPLAGAVQCELFYEGEPYRTLTHPLNQASSSTGESDQFRVRFEVSPGVRPWTKEPYLALVKVLPAREPHSNQIFFEKHSSPVSIAPMNGRNGQFAFRVLPSEMTTLTFSVVSGHEIGFSRITEWKLSCTVN